ncbi:MAG: hypothetical protein WC321_03260 [Candidatus Omnitrophota bacterium]
MEFIKWLIGTSLFGAVIGFFLGKFGTIWDDKRKEKGESSQLFRNLLQEIGNNRFKCQAIIQGRDAVYFEVYSWDVLRLSKYFSLLTSDRSLVDDLYNLYFSIYQANIRVGGVLSAIDSQIRTATINTNMASTTTQVLRDFLNVVLLPRLNILEGNLSTFLRERKIIK